MEQIQHWANKATALSAETCVNLGPCRKPSEVSDEVGNCTSDFLEVQFKIVGKTHNTHPVSLNVTQAPSHSEGKKQPCGSGIAEAAESGIAVYPGSGKGKSATEYEGKNKDTKQDEEEEYMHNLSVF